MTFPKDSASVEALRMGPIKVVQVFTSPAKSGETITSRFGYESPPFSQIRHLCSGKPLSRYGQSEDRC